MKKQVGKGQDSKLAKGTPNSSACLLQICQLASCPLFLAFYNNIRFQSWKMASIWSLFSQFCSMPGKARMRSKSTF